MRFVRAAALWRHTACALLALAALCRPDSVVAQGFEDEVAFLTAPMGARMVGVEFINCNAIIHKNLKTEVMRQLCFMFGVPGPGREDLLAEDDRHYCPNVCILRPAHVTPDDWERLTEDRLAKGALCEECTGELREFFAAAEPGKA